MAFEITRQEILKQAIEFKKLYDQTRDKKYKDQELRLRRIVVELDTLTLGASDLNDLTDVTISAPANAQVLTYNSSTGQWVNQNPTAGTTPTLAQVTTAGNSTDKSIIISKSGVPGTQDYKSLYVYDNTGETTSSYQNNYGLHIEQNTLMSSTGGGLRCGILIEQKGIWSKNIGTSSIGIFVKKVQGTVYAGSYTSGLFGNGIQLGSDTPGYGMSSLVTLTPSTASTGNLGEGTILINNLNSVDSIVGITVSQGNYANLSAAIHFIKTAVNREHDILFKSSNDSLLAERMRIKGSTGNVLINTTTDAGYKLDVNGTARVQGILAATGNYVQFGTNANVGIGSTSTGASFVNNGLALLYATANINNAINLYGHNFYSGNYNATSGTQGVISLTGPPTFTPTSGTAVFNALNLAFTINQTGGANGITRGLYVNPTITAAADFRAIETTAGNVIFNGGNVGAGVLNPTNKLEIFGTGTSGGVSSNVGYNIQPVVAPVITGVTYALQAGTALEIGTYYYRVTYYNAIGETNASAEIPVITTAGNRIVQLNNIPISTDASVIGRKIYRNKVTDGSSYGVVIATLANNTTTTYTDSTPDTDPIFSGSILTRPIYSKANTTARYITVSGTRSMILDPSLTTFGVNAGQNITVAPMVTLFGVNAGQNITYGGGNTLFGANAGGTVTGGFQNVAVGEYALHQVTTGSYNIGIGPFTNNRNNSFSIALGYYTGNSTTGDRNILIGGYIGSSTLAMTDSVIIGHSATPLAATNFQINIANTIYGRSNTGNVMIGTTTDAGYKLDVNGTARVQGAVVAQLASPTSDAFYTISSSAIGFYTSNSYTKAQKLNLTNAVGVPSAPNNVLAVSGSITAASLLAQGVYFNNTLVAAANNDVLVGLDINPTFTNGAFTGVTKLGLRSYSGFNLYSQENGHLLSAVSTSNIDGILHFRRVSSDQGPVRLQLGKSFQLLSNDSSGLVQMSYGVYDLSILVDGTEAMRIPYSRNVLIGTGTDAGYKLDVNGTARVSGAFSATLANTSTANVVYYNTTTGLFTYATAPTATVTSVGGTGTVSGLTLSGTVTSSGNLTLGGTLVVLASNFASQTANRILASPNGVAGVPTFRAIVGDDFGSQTAARVLAAPTAAAGVPTFRAIVAGDFGSQTANRVLAAPNGVAGAPTFRAIVAADIPTLNQSTTGSAASLTTARTLTIGSTGKTFNGTANVSWSLAEIGITASPWITSGTNIYNSNTGNVGIGTATPSYPLHISSGAAANIFGTVQSTNASATAAWVAFNDFSDNVVYRVFGSGATGTQFGIPLSRSASLMANLGGSGKFLLGTFSSTDFVMGTSDQERMRIMASNGNVIIGSTSDNGHKLQVEGNTRIFGSCVMTDLTQTLGLRTQGDLAGAAAKAILVTNALYSDVDNITMVAVDINPSYALHEDGIGVKFVSLRTNSGGEVHLGGYVGIGNTNPTARLHVTGDIKVTTLANVTTANVVYYNSSTGLFTYGAVPAIPSGFTGTFTVPTNPPGQQTLVITNGIITNVL